MVGYRTRVKGHFTIEPPLTWTEQGDTADGLHTWLAALTAGSSEGNP